MVFEKKNLQNYIRMGRIGGCAVAGKFLNPGKHLAFKRAFVSK